MIMKINDYDKVVKSNYSNAELYSLMDVISMIKGLSSLLLNHTSQSLSSPDDNMNKIENLVVVNNFSALGTTSGQGLVYFPDIYNIATSRMYVLTNRKA